VWNITPWTLHLSVSRSAAAVLEHVSKQFREGSPQETCVQGALSGSNAIPSRCVPGVRHPARSLAYYFLLSCIT
jgi:hypothetical protein